MRGSTEWQMQKSGQKNNHLPRRERSRHIEDEVPPGRSPYSIDRALCDTLHRDNIELI